MLNVAWERAQAAFPNAHPRLALILGSGWGDAVSGFSLQQSLPYSQIPGLGPTQIVGHAGELHLARADKAELLIFQGRRHWYEGLGWDPIAIPVHIARQFGASILIVTNAAGSLRREFPPGQILAINDHINAIGDNPLRGPHQPAWGVRFPDQTAVYDKGLRGIVDEAASAVGERIAHGTYAAVCGPTYETPAEVVALRALGADAVGMSTVPEATLAHAAGMRVAGISCLTNWAAGIAGEDLRHEDVIATSCQSMGRIRSLLTAFVRKAIADEC